MSTISNERLDSIERQFIEDGFNDITDSEVVKLVSEVRALRKEREAAGPVYQERRFHVSGKKQIEYWAEINKGAYQYIPESERRIVYTAPPAQPVAVPEFYGPYTPAVIGAGVWVTITDELPPQLEGREVWVTTAPPAPPVADESLPYDPQIAEYEQMMEAEQAQADTTSQQFESLAGKAVYGWIPCSERMPEIGEKVLMRISCNNQFNIESGKYKGEGLWLGCWCSTYGKTGSPYQVAHWMPLPSAPEPCK
ncbi:DUF551 domain-containing protein [Cronobacter sakazakii]